MHAAAAFHDHVVQLYFYSIIGCNRHAFFLIRQFVLSKIPLELALDGAALSNAVAAVEQATK
jgi:hypothetical protein